MASRLWLMRLISSGVGWRRVDISTPITRVRSPPGLEGSTTL